MRITAYTRPEDKPAPHPLQPLVDELNRIGPGESLLATDLTFETGAGWSVEHWQEQLKAAGYSAPVRVEVGDNFRTPQTYIFTVL